MSDRKEFRDLAPPEEAHEVIQSLDIGGGVESVPLSEARGRVLAERIDAGLDVPGFDRASMDGYAVRARDTFGASADDPVVLPEVGAVHAGESPEVTVESGTTVEISTGAVMPDGADAVVVVEQTERREDSDGSAVAIREAVTPGSNVMLAGADVAAGERALGPGTEITPREIGLLSALGVDSVPVRAKPTVGIVSTGDELVRPGQPLDDSAGQIYDVNSYAVATAVEEAGGDPVVYPHVGDDTDAMERVLRKAADETDLVLTSGSTSASAVDVVYRVVEDRGELLLHGVSIKPGKPMLVGRLGGSAYVGLPGYPVSALTIFRTFVAPAIRAAADRPEPATASRSATMATEERFEQGRRRLLPVGLVADGTGDILAYGVDKGSGATTSLTDADGVIDVPADVNVVPSGKSVTVDLFSPNVRPPSVLVVGEDDPALSRLLDGVDRPRLRTPGTRVGLRWLERDVPDAVVVAGNSVGGGVDGGNRLAEWSREWGLVVPAGNPEDVEDLQSLVDRELRFVNRPTDSGLRTTLANALARLAEQRGVERHSVTDAIDGYDFTARSVESPARKVAAGDADAGLGLRTTAAKLDLGFVPVGTETVTILANAARTEKAGVQSLEYVLHDSDDVFRSLPGYSTVGQ